MILFEKSEDLTRLCLHFHMAPMAGSTVGAPMEAQKPQFTSRTSGPCLTADASPRPLAGCCGPSHKRAQWNHLELLPYCHEGTQITWLGRSQDDNSLWGLHSLPCFPTVSRFMSMAAGTLSVTKKSLEGRKQWEWIILLTSCLGLGAHGSERDHQPGHLVKARLAFYCTFSSSRSPKNTAHQ